VDGGAAECELVPGLCDASEDGILDWLQYYCRLCFSKSAGKVTMPMGSDEPPVLTNLHVFIYNYVLCGRWMALV